MNETNSTKLTDEDVELINKEMESIVEESESLSMIKGLPSNNGKMERSEDEKEKGEPKRVHVAVNPETGEHAILGPVADKTESFDEMIDRINEGELGFEPKLDSITMTDLKDEIDTNSESFIHEITDKDLSDDDIKVILAIANRRIKKEKFNIYRELPESVKTSIDKYLGLNAVNFGKQVNSARNMIAEQLVDEFISNISFNKISNDFSKEIEDLFDKGNQEIVSEIVGYNLEKSKKYREYAETIEDEEKKERLVSILDRIDDAYTLDELKEYSKNCKIKNDYLVKPEKHWRSFLNKYNDSKYNIYDLKLCVPILQRNLGNEYNLKDIYAFLACFTRYCMNMDSNNPFDHAFMYYTVYNIIICDMNKGDKKEVSLKFLDNIKEIIENLRKKNNNFERKVWE